nr:CoA transferase [Bacillus sp. ISL-18]
MFGDMGAEVIKIERVRRKNHEFGIYLPIIVELVWDFVELCGSFEEFFFHLVEKKLIHVEFRTPIPLIFL